LIIVVDIAQYPFSHAHVACFDNHLHHLHLA